MLSVYCIRCISINIYVYIYIYVGVAKNDCISPHCSTHSISCKCACAAWVPMRAARATDLARATPRPTGADGDGPLADGRTPNQDRDVDLYHWSSAKFESTWRDTLSVLIARGRAQVGVHSAKSDWSRRILDFAYMDYDDQAAHHE